MKGRAVERIWASACACAGALVIAGVLTVTRGAGPRPPAPAWLDPLAGVALIGWAWMHWRGARPRLLLAGNATILAATIAIDVPMLLGGQWRIFLPGAAMALLALAACAVQWRRARRG